MKRREAKFVHASPRLAPDQLKAAPPVRETRPRSSAGIAPKIQRASAPGRARRGKS
jgi:hypothetical protein